MTFAIFIVLVLGLFIAVLNALPVATAFSPAFSSSVLIIIGYMKAWNFLLPITELFVCVGIVLAFELAIWFWHAIKWTIHFIRGTNTGA